MKIKHSLLALGLAVIGVSPLFSANSSALESSAATLIHADAFLDPAGPATYLSSCDAAKSIRARYASSVRIQDLPSDSKRAERLAQATDFANEVAACRQAGKITGYDREGRVILEIPEGRYDFSSIEGDRSDPLRPKLSIKRRNITIQGPSAGGPPLLYYSGASGLGTTGGHGRVFVQVGNFADNARILNLTFRGDHSYAKREVMAFYFHESIKSTGYAMVVVGTSVNAGRTPRGTLIQSCRFEQINFSGVLINSRSVSLSRSSFSGIADNSNVIMNRDGNLGKNVYGPLNDPVTGFADHPGMAFNSGIVIRSQLYVVSQDGRGWMKPSGATSAYSLGDVETSPVIQIIANDFKNLVEGIVGGTLTSFSPGEFSAQIDAVQGQPLVPKLVVRENYFNLISDHAIYFRGRIPEGSTFSKNAFLRVQQVVIKLAGDLSGEERVGSTAVDRSRKYSRFSGPIGSEIKSNYFALCPSYAVTLNGINNRIFDNRIRRYVAACDPTSERIYDDIQKLSIGGSTQLGRYHDFLLWTEIPGDSARNHSVSNLVFENEKTTGLAETATGSISFLQANEFQRGIGAGCSNGTSSESGPVLIAVQQGPSSNMRAQSNYFGGANQEVHLWFPQSFDVQQGVHAIQYKRDETMEPSRILGPVKESNGIRIRLTARPRPEAS